MALGKPGKLVKFLLSGQPGNLIGMWVDLGVLSLMVRGALEPTLIVHGKLLVWKTEKCREI